MNDGMEFTVVGHEEAVVIKAANEKMGELKDKYWIKNKHSFKDEEEYNSRCYWHLHDTQVEVV
jgi:hypothetical protein